MKLEVETHGLLAKNKEKKTIQIGKEKPLCPSCGEMLKEEGAKCEVCGAVSSTAHGPESGPGSSPVMSRLSDEELGSKLRTQFVMRIVARLLVLPLLIAAMVTCVMALAEGEALYWVLTVALLAGLVYCLLYSFGSKGRMKQFVSVNIVQDALSEVFEDCKYSYDDRLPGSVIQESKLHQDWTEINGSDLVQGKYRGRGIEFSDIKLVKVTEGIEINGHSRQKRETLFQGQWLVYELGCELPASVRVIEKAGRLGVKNALKKMIKSDVETESEAFNQQFRIATSDPHTAFYILTPHFIEYIMAADAAARARTCLCFKGSRIHIALDNGYDLFEIKKWGDMKDIPRLRTRIKGEVKYLTGILDELLQNEYLFGEGN